MVIKVDNLTYRYAKTSYVKALDNISFEINDDKFIIISGASGSGKTTLLYALGGLIAAESGNILVDGCNIAAMNQKESAGYRNKTIGFIFQNYFLDESLSNLENVFFPALISTELSRKEYIARAKDLLCLVGLTTEQISRKPNQLSGGQQQKVAIARSMINSPKIILADEPTGNLDSKNARDIMELLKKLSDEEGMTIILVTHDQNNLSYADRIIHLRDGKVQSYEKQSDPILSV